MPSGFFCTKVAIAFPLFLVSTRRDARSGPTRAPVPHEWRQDVSPLIAFFLSTLQTPFCHFGKKRHRATGSLLKRNNVTLDENACEETKELVIHISEKEIKPQGNGVS